MTFDKFDLKSNRDDREPATTDGGHGIDDEDGVPDPQDTIWSVYISETAQTDKALAEGWKADMDGILIFAGLFSATLTAFITQSYKNLQPDPTDLTIALLTQISSQLANPSIVVPPPVPFKVDRSSFRVNAYWFLSLIFSTSCALGATLVQQWARSYKESVEIHTVPNQRARVRAYLHEGVQMFGIRALVTAIPVLLHISVFFFMLGLFDFLFSINKAIACLTFGVVGGFLLFYAIFTLLPIIYHNSPYRTPLSSICWRIIQAFHLFRFRGDKGRLTPLKQGLSLYRVHVATKPSPARRLRDERALHGLLESFSRDSDFEVVISGIPDFLSSQDDNPGITFWENFQNDEIALCTRITNLLITCQSGGVLSETARHRRAQICLNAIWSLTQSSLLTSHDLSAGHHGVAPKISAWSISQATVAAIAALKHNHSPAIAIYVSCTIAVVSCKILEHWGTAEDVDLPETLKVLELLDVYKFLPAQQQLSLLQQRKQQWDAEQRTGSNDLVQELKKDSTLGQQLRLELALLRRDGYFGVLIAFVHSLSDLRNLSILSGLPLARKTLDVIVSRFPDAPPSKYTQRLLVKCLRRAMINENPLERIVSEPDEDLSPSDDLRQNSYISDSATSIITPNPTRLPISLIDRILPSIVRSLEEPNYLEEAKILVSGYRENYSESVAASPTLLSLEKRMRRDPLPTDFNEKEKENGLKLDIDECRN